MSYRQILRESLSEAQNHRCCYCKLICTIEEDHPPARGSATIEHVIPRSQGGADKYRNMAMACAFCNGMRGILDPYHFEHLIGIIHSKCPEMRDVWHTMDLEIAKHVPSFVRWVYNLTINQGPEHKIGRYKLKHQFLGRYGVRIVMKEFNISID